MAKFRFKKQFEDSEIIVPIYHKKINKDTLQDEDVEFLSTKFPGKFDHNFEEVKAKEAEESKPFPSDEPSEAWTVEQLKAFADYNGITLGRAKKEAAILKKINEAING